MKKNFLFFLLVVISFPANSQEVFSRKDSLRGGLRFERNCFKVLHYGLNIKINPTQKSIVGFNEIEFIITEQTNKIQLDLFANIKVDSIIFNSQKLKYSRDFGAVFIEFQDFLPKNSNQILKFYYSGNPIIAKNAPWDGGFVFSKDSNKKDFIGVACQGAGASLWFPCKDSQTDEPDFGATTKVEVPNGIMNVSNGRFMGKEDLKNGYTRWDWEVKNPINSYDMTINIGDYVHFGENYKGLDLDFYVLRENEAKAKIQFQEVKPMLDCFQSKFGPYPFFEDGYKLVESPYLGMEHQSAVAYGNKFKNGYLNSDLSGTGVGLLFDFILVHESGHEWFGNSITSKDIADMWIHEGFTCYSEAVFLECQFGYEKAQIYINGLKKNIQNDTPIIGQYGVSNEGSGDMYYKGALMLNTIRSILNNDQKWWKLILDYSLQFRHKIIDTETVISFFNQQTGLDLTPIFDQYLRHKNIPILEIQKVKSKLQYRWKTDIVNFRMPVDIMHKGKTIRLQPNNNYQTFTLKIKNISEIKFLTDKFLVNVIIK